MWSSWANKNVRRSLQGTSVKDPAVGWIDRGDHLVYAERNKYTGRLAPKIYPSISALQGKADRLRAKGIDCRMSDTWPFTIIRPK